MTLLLQRTLVLPASRRTVERRVYPGRVMRIVGDCDSVITAREGMLWITFDATRATRPGPWGDYFLKPGQGMVLHKGDQVVLSAADGRHGSALFDLFPFGGHPMPQRSLAARVVARMASFVRSLAGAPGRYAAA